MATSPGYQKREDGNVYYVIGGNTMRVHEVLYKKGAELRLDASEGTLNLKGRKVCINGVDLTEVVNIASDPGVKFATDKDIAAAVKTYTDNSKSSVNSSVDKVPEIPKLTQLSTSLNNFLTALGSTKTVPSGSFEYVHLDRLNTTDWNEGEIVTAVNNIIDLLNAFFDN